MEPNSYLFGFSRSKVYLSQTNVADILSGTSISSRTVINGTGYRMFKLVASEIIVDQNGNLDSPSDLYIIS